MGKTFKRESFDKKPKSKLGTKKKFKGKLKSYRAPLREVEIEDASDNLNYGDTVSFLVEDYDDLENQLSQLS